MAAALDRGYRAVLAIPLRLDDRTVGGLNPLHTSPNALSPEHWRTGQALADLAVLGLSVDRRSLHRAERLAAHTLTVLNDRVAWGHAIGLLAGTLRIGPEEAWTLLYRHARQRARPLREVVSAITDGTLSLQELAAVPGVDTDRPGRPQGHQPQERQS